MTARWCDDFKLGIAILDNQHERFFSILGRLDSAQNTNGNNEILEKIFLDLINYCNYHFATEENAMEKNLFSRFEFHKVLHDCFIEKIYDFYYKFKKNDNSFVLSDSINFLNDWIIDHIMVEDRKYVSAVSDWFGKKQCNQDKSNSKVS
ncbi:MAG: bacteriohemerythrin [Spirochaetia bacterium]|nr:bacteriohemerythrin [Spirochaetia bacterium]